MLQQQKVVSHPIRFEIGKIGIGISKAVYKRVGGNRFSRTGCLTCLFSSSLRGSSFFQINPPTGESMI